MNNWKIWFVFLTLVVFAAVLMISACGGDEEEEEEEATTTGLDVVEIGDKMWTVSDNGDDISHLDAVEAVKTIDPTGFGDWRLPTMNELASLHESGRNLSVSCDDSVTANIASPFKLTCMNVWSSETDIVNGEADAAAYNYVADGWETSVHRDKAQNMRMLAVRP
jgi:Protein of unknown function (DUF1566)